MKDTNLLVSTLIQIICVAFPILIAIMVWVFWKKKKELNEYRQKLDLEAQKLARQAEFFDSEKAKVQAESESMAKRREEAENRHQYLVSELTAERNEIKQQWEVHIQRVQRSEERLARLQDELERESNRVTKLRAELEKREQYLKTDQEKLARQLYEIAQLDAEKARAMVLEQAEIEAQAEAFKIARQIEQQAAREAETKAKKILTTCIQRMASTQTVESLAVSVPLPSEEMKGRIIGREGRNIRTFEELTGVNLLVDDTPETVVLSCFDPVRREIGRLTLQSLIEDGRIHPARIEEAHAAATVAVENICIRAAEDACAEVGIFDIHPELMKHLGRLNFRTSYGQNVLKHLVETAHIAGLLACELGIPEKPAKRASFLHDIGKSLSHEHGGSHAQIGAELASKYGEHEDIVHAIAAHHNEIEVETLEDVIVQIADAISGGRPGARRESLEAYIQRLTQIEELATQHAGVEKVFAMQAGRDIRVMVSPDQVNDVQAARLAKEIANQIERELTYPGEIRITVIRESRSLEIAK